MEWPNVYMTWLSGGRGIIRHAAPRKICKSDKTSTCCRSLRGRSCGLYHQTATSKLAEETPSGVERGSSDGTFLHIW